MSEPLHHEDLFNMHEQLAGHMEDLHSALLGLGDESVISKQTDAVTSTEKDGLTDEHTDEHTDEPKDEHTDELTDERTDELTNSHNTRSCSRTVWYIP